MLNSLRLLPAFTLWNLRWIFLPVAGLRFTLFTGAHVRMHLTPAILQTPANIPHKPYIDQNYSPWQHGFSEFDAVDSESYGMNQHKMRAIQPFSVTQVYMWLCTIVLDNTAQNSSNNLPSHPQTIIIALRWS